MDDPQTEHSTSINSVNETNKIPKPNLVADEAVNGNQNSIEDQTDAAFMDEDVLEDIPGLEFDSSASYASINFIENSDIWKGSDSESETDVNDERKTDFDDKVELNEKSLNGKDTVDNEILMANKTDMEPSLNADTEEKLNTESGDIQQNSTNQDEVVKGNATIIEQSEATNSTNSQPSSNIDEEKTNNESCEIQQNSTEDKASKENATCLEEGAIRNNTNLDPSSNVNDELDNSEALQIQQNCSRDEVSNTQQCETDNLNKGIQNVVINQAMDEGDGFQRKTADPNEATTDENNLDCEDILEMHLIPNDKVMDDNLGGENHDGMVQQDLTGNVSGDEMEDNVVDVDPALLCPEVWMDIEDNTVIANPDTVLQNATDNCPVPDESPVTYVDEASGTEMAFDLTPAEQQIRMKTYGSNPDIIRYKKLHCTACNVHLGSALSNNSARFIHPMLKVLICEKCYHFYTSGEFTKDEDGSELYCRWCGQGGNVLCCSKCEYVFCKKCIRLNCGRKKFVQVRDSEEWFCFRCDMTQISQLRVACVALIEYIRRETARCATLNDDEFRSKDYSRCCDNLKKFDPETSEQLKYIKKPPIIIPNQNIILDDERDSPRHPPQIVPFLSGIDKIGQSRINPVNPVINKNILPSPFILQNNKLIIPQVVKFMPPLMAPPPRIMTFINNNNNNNFKQNISEHKWFEKTVMSAARVTSNFSYTVSQLNKAQCNAKSIEELAVIHNKLQEILSNSINSLINIRKNLRTDFLDGIRKTRFPLPKSKVSGAEQYLNDDGDNDDDDDDDDVILVSGPSFMPKPKSVQTGNGANFIGVAPRLKVRSVSELQNVPAECIIIPDDSSDDLQGSGEILTEDPLQIVNKHSEVLPAESNGSDNIAQNSNVKDVTSLEKDHIEQNDVAKKYTILSDILSTKKTRKRKLPDEFNDSFHYNINDEPSPDVKRMLSVKVYLKNHDFSKL